MPIYEYRCKACNKDFEVLQKVSEPHLASCPDCGKKVKRLISQTSFSLKGGGWYKDGYSARPTKEGGESKPAQSGDKGASQKADQKAEKKAH